VYRKWNGKEMPEEEFEESTCIKLPEPLREDDRFHYIQKEMVMMMSVEY
jgi:hypothetical protein